MKNIYHKMGIIKALVFVGADHKPAINEINEDWDEQQKAGLVVEDINCVTLDWGGMHYGKIPYHDFEIDNYKFSLKLDKLEGVLELCKRAKPIWGGMHVSYAWSNHIYSSEVLDKLIKCLEELKYSDEVLNASMQMNDIMDELSKSGKIIFNIPKEL